MGLFDKMRGKGEETPKTTPVKEVIDLRNSGMNNDQIINQLRAEGYEFQQIKDALSQAELKAAANNNNTFDVDIPQTPSSPTQNMEAPSFETPSFSPAPGMEVKDRSVEEIERILEQIIEEKWGEVEEKLKTMEEWKNKIEKEMEKINTRIDDFKSRIDSIESTLTAKVDEYSKNMQEVSVEMQALDKVMSKLIPTLTDNIKELKELTEKKKSEEYFSQSLADPMFFNDKACT